MDSKSPIRGSSRGNISAGWVRRIPRLLSRTVPRGPGGSQGGQRSVGPPPPYSFFAPYPSALDPSPPRRL